MLRSKCPWRYGRDTIMLITNRVYSALRFSNHYKFWIRDKIRYSSPASEVLRYRIEDMKIVDLSSRLIYPYLPMLDQSQ